MTELEKYKLAAEKLRFLIRCWLQEDRGCTCSECKELLAEAEELLDRDKHSDMISEGCPNLPEEEEP